ncbi:hypothetical protein J6590_050493 [Homalodisca vitripennis]|nr:hypothetical protein J6590_050493 [Homalodisca vitripennis]
MQTGEAGSNDLCVECTLCSLARTRAAPYRKLWQPLTHAQAQAAASLLAQPMISAVPYCQIAVPIRAGGLDPPPLTPLNMNRQDIKLTSVKIYGIQGWIYKWAITQGGRIQGRQIFVKNFKISVAASLPPTRRLVDSPRYQGKSLTRAANLQIRL